MAAVYGVWAGVVVAHALGMPLEGQDRALRMGDGFYDAVVGHLDHLETGSHLVNGLVVGAVGGKVSAVVLSQPAIGCGSGHMDLVFGDPLVTAKLGNVLDQAATKMDVDDLMAFTDAQDRFVCVGESIQDGKLFVIQFGIDALGTIDRLTIAGWIYIGTARQDQAVVLS